VNDIDLIFFAEFV